MIRLCYTVATPECEDPNMLALRGPLSGSFELLAGAGYAAAELMVREPQRLDAGDSQDERYFRAVLGHIRKKVFR